MANSRWAPIAAALALALGLAACGKGMDKSDPHYAELEEANLWIKQLKAEDPDTGAAIAQACQEEVGFWMSEEGVLEMSRCMRRKYDEGMRA